MPPGEASEVRTVACRAATGCDEAAATGPVAGIRAAAGSTTAGDAAAGNATGGSTTAGDATAGDATDRADVARVAAARVGAFLVTAMGKFLLANDYGSSPPGDCRIPAWTQGSSRPS
jgi:hypothetical protein